MAIVKMWVVRHRTTYRYLRDLHLQLITNDIQQALRTKHHFEAKEWADRLGFLWKAVSIQVNVSCRAVERWD